MTAPTQAEVPAEVQDVHQYLLAAVEASDAVKAWTERLERLKARLHDLHEEGLIGSKFDYHKHKFNLQEGRKTDSLDDFAKEFLAEKKKALKAQGHITQKTGNPFWSIKGGPEA